MRYNECNIDFGFTLHLSSKKVWLNKIGNNMKNTPGRDFTFKGRKHLMQNIRSIDPCTTPRQEGHFRLIRNLNQKDFRV